MKLTKKELYILQDIIEIDAIYRAREQGEKYLAMENESLSWFCEALNNGNVNPFSEYRIVDGKIIVVKNEAAIKSWISEIEEHSQFKDNE